MKRIFSTLRGNGALYMVIGALLALLVTTYLRPSTAHANDWSMTAIPGWSTTWNSVNIDNPFTTRTTEGNSADLGTSTTATPTYLNMTSTGGNHYCNGNLEVHGTFYPPTITLLPIQSNVDLTSPTVTFSAAGKYMVSLKSNAALTGVHPLGGTTGQVIIMTSDRGTVSSARFDDDATSMAVGANFTLTNGQYDVLALRCVAAPASSSGYGQWQKLYGSDN